MPCMTDAQLQRTPVAYAGAHTLVGASSQVSVILEATVIDPKAVPICTGTNVDVILALTDAISPANNNGCLLNFSIPDSR